MTEYLDRSAQLPYCAGCGHPHVLRSLDQALRRLDLASEQVVLVTDIGCVGLADAFFPGLHTVHTLHGRSVAIAAGLRMGRLFSDESPLKPIVLIGDGGAGLGLLHLVHAAQINVDVTVLVHNNLIYGMTGGQHSVLTPPGLKTTTTPRGCDIPPLDLGAVLMGAGAGFFARTVAPGDDVQEILAQAIDHPGFACVEILELCPTFATKRGGVTGKRLKTLPQERGLELGVLRRDTSLKPLAASAEEDPAEAQGIVPEAGLASLDRTARIVLAGRAGERVQSSALLAANAAAAAGLMATVRADNPVTQGSGFSVAELTLAPEPIAYTGLVSPDVVICVAPEGLGQLESRGLLEPPGCAERTLIDAELEIPSGLECERPGLRARYGGKRAALGALVETIEQAGWFKRRAWELAIAALPAAQRADAEAVIHKLA